MIRNSIATSYLFYRFPSRYALMYGPLLVSVSIYYSASKIYLLEGNFWNSVNNYQFSLLQNYIFNFQLVYAIMCSFFLTYRWTSMKKDMTYGYWLTQGIDRKRFFIRSTFSFMLHGFAGSLLGLLLIVFGGGAIVGIADIFKIILLLFINLSLITSTAILLGEIINNPEFAMMLFVIIYALIIIIGQTSSNACNTFADSINIANSSCLINFMITLLVAIIIYGGAYKLHLSKDVAL